jgi:hypothetical protein
MGDDDIVDSSFGHDFRLVGQTHLDATGPGGKLHFSYLGTLVDFMRAAGVSSSGYGTFCCAMNYFLLLYTYLKAKPTAKLGPFPLNSEITGDWHQPALPQ